MRGLQTVLQSEPVTDWRVTPYKQAMCVAASKGLTRIIRLLLEHGAEPDVTWKKDKTSPLHEVQYSLVFDLYSLVFKLCPLVFNLYSHVFESCSLVFDLYSPVFNLCSLDSDL